MKTITASAIGFVAAVGTALGASGDVSLEKKLSIALGSRASHHRDVRAQGMSEVFSEVGITNESGAVVVGLTPDAAGDGLIAVTNRLGSEVPTAIRVGILVSAEDTGQVAVFNPSGQPRYILDGNRGLLSAAGDVAEMFPAPDSGVTPGTVPVIDPHRPGTVRASTEPYDRRVAGVASGAHEHGPGITLRTALSRDGSVAVTLSGTVYCRATALNGPIRAGDLLNTSSVAGHAMKATDAEASRGAVLGKAMEDLKAGDGVILVLASLQ